MCLIFVFKLSKPFSQVTGHQKIIKGVTRNGFERFTY